MPITTSTWKEWDEEVKKEVGKLSQLKRELKRERSYDTQVV